MLACSGVSEKERNGTTPKPAFLVPVVFVLLMKYLSGHQYDSRSELDGENYQCLPGVPKKRNFWPPHEE